MGEPGGAWIRRLQVDPDRAVSPVCSPDVLEPAIEQLGPGPVAWSVLLGHDIAEKAMEAFPEFGETPAQLTVLRWATEPATIALTRMIDNGELIELSADSVRAVHDYVHRRIPLSTVWAAMRRGHAWVAEAFMATCADALPLPEQPLELRRVSDTVFAVTDRYSAAVAREYNEEQARWMMTTVAAREKAVKAILARVETDVARAEHTLQYMLTYRNHVGMIVWFEGAACGDGSALPDIAAAALRAIGAEQTLCVPQGLTSVLAWGNNLREVKTDELRSVLQAHAGVRAALGEPGEGLEGFRHTYEQARAARAVVEGMPGFTEKLVRFADVRLLAFLAQDVDAASRFVTEVLGDLSKCDPHVAEIRRTTEAYLRLKRSPSAVAGELFVAPNTVRYRLKKAEEMLGHDLDDHTLETWVALTLGENLGIGDSHDRKNRPGRTPSP